MGSRSCCWSAAALVGSSRPSTSDCFADAISAPFSRSPQAAQPVDRRLKKKQNRAEGELHATRRAIGDFPLSYWPGFSPLAVSREASAFSEGALASSRPRACDFRRLRFSRSASFSRSRRKSFRIRAGLACSPVLIVLHR